MREHVPVTVTQPHSFREQFARPTGFWGQMAGYLMALTNQPVNRLVCQLLDVQPHDRVLEIGFGPGRLIELLAPLVPQGLVAGVDPSEVMVRQATRRNAAWIRTGRVALLHGTVSALPWRDQQFSKVCAVNSFYFWPRPLEDLRELGACSRMTAVSSFACGGTTRGRACGSRQAFLTALSRRSARSWRRLAFGTFAATSLAPDGRRLLCLPARVDRPLTATHLRRERDARTMRPSHEIAPWRLLAQAAPARLARALGSFFTHFHTYCHTVTTHKKFTMTGGVR